jgi:hypothetical protein
MNCQQCRERLHDYLDETIEAAERELLSAHLTACAGCRRELEELRKVAALVGSLDELPVPGGFLQAVRARIDQPTVWDRLRGLLVRPRPSVSVAIPIIIVAFVAVFYVMTRPPRTAEQARTQPESKKPEGELQLAYDHEARSRVDHSIDGRVGGGLGGPGHTEETAGTNGTDLYTRGNRGEYEDKGKESPANKAEGSELLDESNAKNDELRLGDARSRDRDTDTSARAKGGTTAGIGAAGGPAVTNRDHGATTDEEPADRTAETGPKEEVQRVDTVTKEVGPRQDDMTVQFVVLDLGTDLVRLRRIAVEHGGFVTEQREKEALTALVLNVPVKQFDKTVEQVQLENAKNTKALDKTLRENNAQQERTVTRLLLIVRRVEEVQPGQ